MKKLMFVVLALLAGQMQADRIDRATAREAAGNWMRRNGIARSLFSEATISEIAAYDADANLWIVRLSPHGYVILAGSDLRKPVIAFSQNDFEWPEEGSPFAARLNASAAATVMAEAAGGGKDPEWESLAGGASLMAAVQVDSSKIVVPPFVNNVQWSQWQPYNDFSPVYNSSGTGEYRGRVPCGCVATALAQVLAYWKWPYRMEGSRTVDHDYYPNGNNTSPMNFPIRFDGNVPFDWDSLAKEYACYKNGYDLRGKVAESVRFPVARLILFADNLADMQFNKDGSGANSQMACAASTDWYTAVKVTEPKTEKNLAVSRMKDDLQKGRPVLVSIPGHAIFTHGWAEDGSNYYVYHNYGWGGSNDGWFLLCGNGNAGEDIEQCYTGFYPKPIAQVEPLPAVSSNSVTLKWHFPDIHTNSVIRFNVNYWYVNNGISNFTDNFSERRGAVMDSENGGLVLDAVNEKNYLRFDPLYRNSYTYSSPFWLTSRSELSFKVKSEYALDSQLEVQARIDGVGGWQTISTIALTQNNVGDWKNVRLYFGDKGGSVLQLRFAIVRTGLSYYGNSNRSVCISDLKFSDVLLRSADFYTANRTERSFTIPNLGSGRQYIFYVTPELLQDDGAQSQPVMTQIAGTSQKAIPGELTYRTTTSSYSPTDPAWEIDNSNFQGTAIHTDWWNGSVGYAVSGELTQDSTLSFDWTANGYYVNLLSYDLLTVTFTDSAKVQHQVWKTINSSNQSERTTVNLPLGAYAGKRGKITISFSHIGNQYSASQYGMVFYNPVVSNVVEALLPESVAWETKTYEQNETPVIQSVTGSEGHAQVAEGFYRENARGGNVLWVKCSDSVKTLLARPSHLALVSDDDITVHSRGNGEFAVVINADPAKVPNRSRMILTLEARTANGTAAYKDLSLRFDSSVQSETYVALPTVVDVPTTMFGTETTVQIPIEWFVNTGLAQSGASVDYVQLALQDSDGDGFSNVAEYVCGTLPLDASDRLQCFIEMINGSPCITHSAVNLPAGYRAVVKGTVNLSQPDWQTQSSAHRFFKVVIERTGE